jgi:hypothetical protein
MTSQSLPVRQKQTGLISLHSIILFSFATVFFPRFFASFGAPAIINFVHFGIVPIAVLLVVFNIKERKIARISVVRVLLMAVVIIFTSTIASALLNTVGFINIFLQFILETEAVMFLAAVIALHLSKEALDQLRKWLLIFAFINLILAIAQSVLLPLGIYPKPKGGTIQDNITGVFGGGGGSASNYISCTISFYFSIYFFRHYKNLKFWIRIAPLIGAIYQIQVSDSKQVFMALLAGLGLLLISKIQNPVRFIFNLILILCITWLIGWVMLNLDFEVLKSYQNWINRPIWGWDGLAVQTKFAGFWILPPYFETPLHWLLGLGPGHSVTRLGGWVLRDYDSLLLPLGATTHPATEEFWALVQGPDGWLARESTGYFPLFTWMGLWGDLGLLGLAAYLYLGFVVWKLCVDDFCRFLLLSTAVFGVILTQMEEPGQMLTIAVLIGLRWQEEFVLAQSRQTQLRLPAQREQVE